MSGCDSIQSWFVAEFKRRYRDAKCGDDEATVAILDRCRAKTMTGIDNLQVWSRGVLAGKIPGENGGGDFRVAIFETIDWADFQHQLEVLDDDDEEAVREKQREIETALRAIKLAHDVKEQECDCCEITYPESKIDLEGGKWLCKSCQNEYPYPVSLYEPGNTCPALFKIVDALSSSALKQEQALKETGNLLYLPPLSD